MWRGALILVSLAGAAWGDASLPGNDGGAEKWEARCARTLRGAVDQLNAKSGAFSETKILIVATEQGPVVTAYNHGQTGIALVVRPPNACSLEEPCGPDRWAFTFGPVDDDDHHRREVALRLNAELELRMIPAEIPPVSELIRAALDVCIESSHRRAK